MPGACEGANPLPAALSLLGPRVVFSLSLREGDIVAITVSPLLPVGSAGLARGT